jgi:isopenicillin N synthase-like dioxygenase
MLDVIDLDELRSDKPENIVRIGAKIGRACREVGFFYVRNHGIRDDVLSGMFTASATA